MSKLLNAVAILALVATPALAAKKPKGPPEVVPVTETAAPASARLFADCFADAAQAADGVMRDGRYLHFICHGAPAQRFYDALGARAADKSFEVKQGDKVTRFTQVPDKDTYGLDHCWSDPAADGDARYGCRLVYPAGVFLDG